MAPVIHVRRSGAPPATHHLQQRYHEQEIVSSGTSRLGGRSASPAGDRFTSLSLTNSEIPAYRTTSPRTTLAALGRGLAHCHDAFA